MSETALGAILGLSTGCGLVLIYWWLLATRVTLANRIRPYTVGDSGFSDQPLVALLAAIAAAATSLISSLGSTNKSVTTRQTQMLQTPSLASFRIRQLATGGVFALAAATLAILSGRLQLFALLIIVVIATLAGALYCDWALGQKLAKFRADLTEQLPDAAEMLALSVSAGETVGQALYRVEDVIAPPLAQVLEQARLRHRSGMPLSDALRATSTVLDCPALERVFTTLATALDRGSPLAAVLHDIAHDARDIQRRHLMEIAGKKEIAMLIPVVFFILPLTVLFALYPGLLYMQMF